MKQKPLNVTSVSVRILAFVTQHANRFFSTRILRHRFPGTCETVGQVFKFVWRLHWKI